MKSFFILLVVFNLLLLIGCGHKNTAEETKKFSDQLVNDPFTMTGDYHWSFQLMGGLQQSVHTFYADSITYSMEGKVYSTAYTMKKLSYDDSIKKWIGQDEDGFVYVLFFKEPTAHTLTLYKRKCKVNGLEEAINFGIPASDATDDHGWNVYARNNLDTADELLVSGTYTNDKYQLVLENDQVVLDDVSFSRLSYHAGERRWVGQAGTVYLQIFIGKDDSSKHLSFSVGKFNDLEKAYRTKYADVKFARYDQR
ncbi:MAG: hypothetical protein AAGI38_02965 [Bacteroidota bacterium]